MLTVWCIVWYSKKPKFEQIPSANLDADDPLDDDDEEDSDEDDSEDDAAELQAELMKIKKERAADQARKVRFQVFKFSSYTLFQKGNMYRWNTSINEQFEWNSPRYQNNANFSNSFKIPAY